MSRVRALPDVTLVVIDNVEKALCWQALAATLREIRPAEILVWSDNEFSLKTDVPVRNFYARMKDICDVEEVLWRIVPKEIRTSHLLTIQWDGWVLNGNAWMNEFLDYDYIGAPWTWYATDRIGNGGFSLRSAKLMRELATYDIVGAEDTSLCRFYRKELEALGYRWAPEDLAKHFSVEHGPDAVTFGFHGAFNFPRVVPPDEFVSLFSLAGKHARKSPGWGRMLGAL